MTTRHDGIFESERSGRTPPIHHGPSRTVGPQSPAGGQVPVHHYTGRGPAPRSGNGTTTLDKAHGQ
jgi:hypothetical protein